MEGAIVCPRCRTEVADNKALVCPSCGYTLRLPTSAKLGLTVMGLAVLALLVWTVTIKGIFDSMATLISIFYSPITREPFVPPPAPDIRTLLGVPLGTWVGNVIDWLGLNPSLPLNDTLLWIGIAILFLGLAIAVYGAVVVRRAQARAAPVPT